MMPKERLKTFDVAGDRLQVPYRYDEQAALWLGQFPDFEEHPRYTPEGRPWKSVVTAGCPYATGAYDDCGSCTYLVKGDAQDIIGVCFYEGLCRRETPAQHHQQEDEA